MCASVKKEVTIDLKKVSTKEELQNLLKQELDFPDYYGGNWDAFWDTITGLVELPEKIIFEHWSDLEESIPDEANSLKEMMNNFNKKYPMMKTEDVVDRITFIK
ncbi:barnase inhibitor [Listeria monocytogenes]|nr:barnase inhibitor [Listeria monocytogenes]EAF5966966.1 barnase inhibitor [Listeria monocytogenes]